VEHLGALVSRISRLPETVDRGLGAVAGGTLTDFAVVYIVNDGAKPTIVTLRACCKAPMARHY
jgi:hypothetical protein